MRQRPPLRSPWGRPSPRPGAGETERDWSVLLLGYYAAERQQQTSVLQIIAALVAVLATYLIATVGLAVQACSGHISSSNSQTHTFHLLRDGCSAIPYLVSWAAPLPALALLLFLAASHVVLISSARYTEHLEAYLDLYRDSHRVLVSSPVRTMSLYRSRSVLDFLPKLSFGIAYLMAAAYVVGIELFILPWSNARWSTACVSLGVAVLYLSLTLFCTLSGPLAARRYLPDLRSGWTFAAPAPPGAGKPAGFWAQVRGRVKARPAKSTLEIRLQPAREVVRVKPVGELDLATGPKLREQVTELVAIGFSHLIIDLRGVSFMDVSGLTLLLALTDRARGEEWRLSLIQGNAQLQRIFALTNTLDRLPFCRPGRG